MHKQYPAWARLFIGTVRMRRHAQMEAVAEATPLGKASKCVMATFSLCSNFATDY